MTDLMTPSALQELWPSLTDRQKTEIEQTLAGNPLYSLTYDEFAGRFMWIEPKEGDLIPFTRKPAQRDLEAAIERLHHDHGIRFHLVVKSRQLGITSDRIGNTCYVSWKHRTRSLFMAHDGDTTAKMRTMAKTFYDELPDAIKSTIIRSADNATITRYMPLRSEITIATAGAESSGEGKSKGGKGRGGTYNRIHLSEAAYYKNPGAIIAGATQGLSPNGICVVETTANGAAGWTYEMAMNPTAAWAVHFYAWWWDDDYAIPLKPGEVIELTEEEERTIRIAADDGFELTLEQIKWKRNKIAELGMEAGKFPQEYPETLEDAFLTSGNGIFGDVSHAVVPEGSLERVAENTHIASIDWGMSNDWTVLGIGDASTGDEMFITRWRRMQWFDLIERIVDELARWGVTKVYPESNSMPMQIEALRNEINKRGLNIAIWPIKVTAQNKGTLIKGLYAAIHVGGSKFQDAPWATSEFHTFVATQSKSGHYQYEATSGAHDDAVMMRAFLCWGFSQTLK